MTLATASDSRPYAFRTGRDIVLDFSLETVVSAIAADTTAVPEDLSDVTAAEVALRRRGLPATEISWDTEGGQVSVVGNLVRLVVDKADTATLTPGSYEAQLNLTRADSVDECALIFTIVIEQGVGG